MPKIRDLFNQLKQQNKKAFIPYLTYGFPNLGVFEQTVLAIAKTGVDAIEIGMPFSDPIADGPVIQRSSQIALEKGATLPGLLLTLKKLRRKVDAPFILMTYYNPVFYMGDNSFCRKAKGIIDALVVPDLLPEEGRSLNDHCRKYGIDTVFFIAPTTDLGRYGLIDKNSSGFIYYVSVTGTTGSRNKFDGALYKKIAAAKAKVKGPVCVGFGISTHEQVKRFCRVADGVIVGSAIIKFIDENHKQKNFIDKLQRFIVDLKGKEK
jgi:tryptophan synthase alpha chain